MESIIEVQPLTAEEIAQAELQTAWDELQNVASYVERKQEEED